MKKMLTLLPLLFLLAACAAQPTAAPDLTASVNATLTAVAQNAAPTSPPPTAQPTATPPSGLSLDQLRGGVYTSPDWGTFQLTDGIYYRALPTGQESPEAYTTRMLEPVLYGDIDLDGVEDALVFLATQNGGTGHFVEMAVVLNRDGSASNAATLSLGDRVVIESGAIEGGVITLQMRVHGPSDPMCCPSQAVTWAYHFENGVLVRLP